MNKTLLKRILLERLSRLAQLESWLETIEATASPSVAPLAKSIRAAYSPVCKRVLDNRDALKPLFDESPLADSLANQVLADETNPMSESVQALASLLHYIEQPTVPPEMELLIKSLSLSKLLPDAPPLVVLSAEALPKVPVTEGASPQALVSTLSILDNASPLQWLSALSPFLRHFAQSSVQVKSLLDELKLPGSAEDHLSVLVPVFQVRLMGPGFYVSYVLESLMTQNPLALWVVEPLLFQGLNRFGLVNKDLVILHQGVERVRQHWQSVAPTQWLPLMQTDELSDRLLKLSEKMVPDRLAYTEKAFTRTQLLNERLEEGILLSAVPMVSSSSQLRDELGALLSDNEPSTSVYGLLGQLRESPATPREIINAGWIYRLDNTSDWLQALVFASNAQEGWKAFKGQILELDRLLVKSIEVSEVHRVLSSVEDAELAGSVK